jgi:hypothetical protein
VPESLRDDLRNRRRIQELAKILMKGAYAELPSHEGRTMFFLLRVAFWLAIVFAFLPWPEDVRPPAPAEVAPKAREILGKLFEQASAGAARACLEAPGACLEAAAGVSLVGAEKRGDAKSKPRSDGAPARP